MNHLVTVTADLSRIPAHKIPVNKGKDGLNYYIANYQIQVIHYSANTTYELIHDGISYGEITAEYV